jgi:hypothetical protein
MTIDDRLRRAGPHRTRPIRFARVERVGDWRIKLYTITTHGTTVRPELVAETVRRAPEVYPAPAETDDRYGVGFAIAHDAMTSSIVLYYWWQSFIELHQRLFAGPKADPQLVAPLEYQTAGCVWELDVIDFERRAWLADVLANPAGPDVERYLSRRHDADV